MSEGRCKVDIVLCFVILCLMTATGRERRDVMSGSGVSLMKFRLTKITQQSSRNGYNVQLHFSGTNADLPTVYLMNRFAGRGRTERVGKPSNGMIEFHTDSSHDWIVFLHPRGYQRISLRLNDRSPSEHLVPDTELYLQEGREVTFEEGADTQLNYRFSVHNSSRHHASNFYLYGEVAVRSTTEDHVVRTYVVRNQFPFLDPIYTQSDNDLGIHVTLLTSSGDVEGLVEIDGYIRFDCSPANPCLIEDYLIHEDIPVYREDHDGPFPRNYIGFLQYPSQYSSNLKVCSIHVPERCSLDCQFVGDRPSAVQFTRIAGHLNPSHQMSFSDEGFRATGSLAFENLPAPGEAEYQCKSRSGPQEVSRITKVVVIHDAKINRNLTTLTRLNDGTVEAVCVAEGTPAPTLFQYGADVYVTSIHGNVSEDRYDVVVTKPNSSTTKAVLRVHDHATANALRYVICRAVNGIRGQVYTDEFPRHLPPRGQGSTK